MIQYRQALSAAVCLTALTMGTCGVWKEALLQLGSDSLLSEYSQLLIEDNRTTLDLSEKNLTVDMLRYLLLEYPQLEMVDVRGCELTPQQIAQLAESFPNILFLQEITLPGGQTVMTDAESLDLSGVPLSGIEEIEALLPCFPNLKKVEMCECGIDDETMDALNQRYEDIRFIWSVWIKDSYVRTDTTYFYPFKIYRSMIVRDEDIQPLRYCTDIVAVDIGHMTTVTDLSWVRYMPNLQYLIIAETAVVDLSPLASCKNLKFLEMFSTPVTDYSPLLECTALEDLNLGITYGDPNVIAQMTWLKNLWWSGVDGTAGLICSNARPILEEALPNTTMKFRLSTPNAKNGWRQLQNYYDMRDIMDVFYLQ